MQMNFFTISQMQEKYKVTARALRFYEAKGLISPTRESSRRLYSPQDAKRLGLILKAKRYGLTLSEIRDLLDGTKNGDPSQAQAERVYEIFKNQLYKLIKEHAELGKTINVLKAELEEGAKTLRASNSRAA